MLEVGRLHVLLEQQTVLRTQAERNRDDASDRLKLLEADLRKLRLDRSAAREQIEVHKAEAECMFLQDVDIYVCMI